MRAMLIAILAAAALWSGWWYIGARGLDGDLRAWLDGRADAGWVANYTDIAVQGFPNRFDSTITGLELADPATGVAWTAPTFQILRLSYDADHVIAVWPGQQSLASPHQRITIDSAEARASVVFRPGSDFELDRLSAIARDLRLNSNAGWSAELAEGRLATRPSEATPGHTDLAIEATRLRPASPALAQLAAMDILPGVIDRLRIDATLGFDAPWDRAAVETRRPAITALELDKAELVWGQAEIWAAGELSFDRAGLASGSVTVKAKNWRDLLQVAVASGWLPQAMAETLEQGLGLLAGLSGSSKTPDAPLTFRRGKVSFGPIPLGSLPPLQLR